MPRSSKVNSFVDVSERAQDTLDYIISGEDVRGDGTGEDHFMPVTEALESEGVVRFGSSRTQTRILFLSSDTEGLKDTSWLQKHVRDIHTKFAEVHIAIIASGKKREFPIQRLEQNIWLYQVNLSSMWFLNETMARFAESQLQFGDGFRPDVIVALDPFEAGLAAISLAQQYERPLQVHVLKDFLSPSFTAANKENKKRVKLAHKVLKSVSSVRAGSSLIKDALAKEFPKIEDLGVLPRHFDTDTMLKTKRTNELKQKYPQYAFIALTAGTLDQDSTLYRTLDAARTMLFSPKIGLVVVGDGPQRAALQERARLLGIQEQVVFETNQSFLGSYMLSADVFICTDTTAVGDEYVIQAAAAGLPIVMARTTLRDDLFVDGESAQLCPADDTTCFSQKINAILNTNAFRIQFSSNARQMVKDRLHTDPDHYRNAYRDSIEVVFGKIDVPINEEGFDLSGYVLPKTNRPLSTAAVAAPPPEPEPA